MHKTHHSNNVIRQGAPLVCTLASWMETAASWGSGVDVCVCVCVGGVLLYNVS